MSATVPIACLFRTAWPENTAKHAARASGLSVRTAQGWMSERFTPSASTLLRMADRNDKLRAELIKRLALQQGYSDGDMAAHEGRAAAAEARVLPVARSAASTPRRKANGPRADLAKEG